ncbi:hypothetical protein V494_02248 [Pseudogymnoascus sp. VKM F-4513 (FW-928)]|nr:hypothetical protein V494_02248 [Pseudogymnoascus sp. VKM F-4513 (FW-928)]
MPDLTSFWGIDNPVSTTVIGLKTNATMDTAIAPNAAICQLFTTSLVVRNVRRFTQKQNLHVRRGESVISPPSVGPRTDATPYILVTIPTNRGLWRICTVLATITRPPQKIPAAPNPATALPIMKAVELGAAAHTTEPTSNMAMAVMKVNFKSKYV